MNNTPPAVLDQETRGYLKHYESLESARERAHNHLNQTWLQLNRLILSELDAELQQSNQLEVISPDPNAIIGLRWTTSNFAGGVMIEIADVRRWTQVSGDRVVFTISSPKSATREYLRQVFTEVVLESAFRLGDELSQSLLRYSKESSRVISLALPLTLGTPRGEAQAILESLVLIWEIMEERRDDLSALLSPPTRALLGYF